MDMIRHCGLLALAAFVAVGPVIVPPASANQVDDCRQNGDLALKVQGCTALLGALDGVADDHPWAYAERANGVCWHGEADRAVADIWRWFDADPASIRRMQGKLAQLGFYTAEIDGGFSAELDDAVIAWADAGCPEAG